MLKDQRETSSATGEMCEVPAAPPSHTTEIRPAAGPALAVKTCTVPGCTGRFLARGYCVRHYYQVKRHGVVQAAGERFARAPRPRPDGGEWRSERPVERLAHIRREAACMDGECAETPFARGLCRLHYIMARSQDLLA